MQSYCKIIIIISFKIIMKLAKLANILRSLHHESDKVLLDLFRVSYMSYIDVRLCVVNVEFSRQNVTPATKQSFLLR